MTKSPSWQNLFIWYHMRHETKQKQLLPQLTLRVVEIGFFNTKALEPLALFR